MTQNEKHFNFTQDYISKKYDPEYIYTQALDALKNMSHYIKQYKNSVSEDQRNQQIATYKSFVAEFKHAKSYLKTKRESSYLPDLPDYANWFEQN